MKPRPGPTTIDLACRKAGLRLTRQRRTIASVLASARDHPDVQDLHHRVAAIDPDISLTTVYRTMKLFAEHGLVWCHDFRGRRARYEWADGEAHDHMIDVTDGSIIDFRSSELERILAEIAEEFGYRTASRRLELHVLPIKLRRRMNPNRD